MAIETIVLAVGSSDRDRVDELASTTADVAGPAGATVAVLHAVTREEHESIRTDLNADESLSPDDVARRHEPVRAVTDLLASAGIDHSVHGRIGEEGDTIVGFAREHDADLVVVGGRRRSPTGKAVFGSTAQAVMLSAPCPVTFVRGDDGE